MIDSTTAALMLASYGFGGVSALTLYVLLRQPRPTHTPVEGISGLSDALDAAGRDLPTAELPRQGPGPGYTGGHRRKGKGRWLANLGRTHARRNAAAQRHLP